VVDEEDVIIPENEVTRATKEMLSGLYPNQAKSPRESIHVRRKPKRNAILNRYRGKSNSLHARGFDTTELDNIIAVEQTKIDIIYTH